MRDVQLWWRLHDAPGPDQVEELGQLAELPLRDRSPFIGLVAPLLTHEDVGLRRAAVRVLSGARGVVGMRALVDALSDPEESVRLAAVESLREVSLSEPARWAHVVFHPRADVRSAGLAGEVQDNCAHYAAFLRVDPETRALAEKHPFPKPGLGLVTGLWLRNAISPEDASAVYGAATMGHLREWILGGRRRTAAMVREYVRVALTGSRPPVVGLDVLDVWVAVIAATPPEAAKPALRSMMEAVFGSKLVDARPRLTVALLGFAQTHGFDAIPDGLLELAAGCDLRMLAMTGYAASFRRRAARGLLPLRNRIGRVSSTILRRLLESDLVRDAEGKLDLLTATALVGLLPSERIRTLVERFGFNEVVAAIRIDFPAWLALCDLPDESDQLISTLLEAAARRDERIGTALTAIALGRFALHHHDALDRTLESVAPVGPLLAEIVVQAQNGTIPSSPEVVGRLGNRLTPRAYLGELSDLLVALIERLSHEPESVACAMIGSVAGKCDPADFAVAVSTIPEPSAVALIAELGESITLRRAHQLALAEALSDAEDEALRQWAHDVEDEATRPKASPAVTNAVRSLSDAEMDAIAFAEIGDLDDALAPALAQPCSGLVAALDRRPLTGDHHVPTCVALIGCADELPRVSALIDQWHGEGEEITDMLRTEVVRRWTGMREASWLAQAWMSAFERHGFGLLARVDAHEGGILAVLEMIDALPGAIARRQLWHALASAVTLRRYRERAKLVTMMSPQLDAIVDHVVKQIDTDVGVSAAKILVNLHLGGLNVTGWRKPVLLRAPDMDRETIHELARFIRVDGVPVRTVAARPRQRSIAERELDEIRKARDLDELEQRCCSRHPSVVHTAALRLVDLGTLGERRLTALLCRQPPIKCFRSVAQTLGGWSDSDSLERIRELARDDTTPAEMQYRLAVALHDRGEPGWFVSIFKALRVPTGVSWFRRDEWEELVERYPSGIQPLSLELVDSPHPHVYRNAMEQLLTQPMDDDIHRAFRRFLEQGALRPDDLRRAAARELNDRSDPYGLPVLMAALCEPQKGWDNWVFKPPTPELAQAIAELLLASSLYGGPPTCDENRLLALLEKLEVPAKACDEIAGRLLLDARSPAACKRIVQARGPRAERWYKILDIADIFAWGVRRGRELTGRLFRVHMTWRRGDYGHTYLDSNSIHVTPLPVLRGDKNGRDVVEALILHEFGHHMYHRGPEKQRVWQRATKEGLGHLLNLVADEHLERNLRATRSEYGDRLKRLASYAFQHQSREMRVDDLLLMLGASAFEALSHHPLDVAYDGRCVKIQSGEILRELERIGNPFARFVRALRQGLGNRHEDPIVEEALGLFRNRFRHSDMERLYVVTKRLQELFGIDAKMAEQFGGHETIKGDNREAAIHGDGIDDDEVQREIERILDPKQLDRMRSGRDDGGKPRKLAVNVIDDDSFNKITTIERVAPDPDAHRKIALEIRRHSDRVRHYFEQMGLNYVPRRARIRGRAFDKTRVQAVVIRRDPRMLVARELTITTDLFIGVVIDCSGSMRTGGSMDKAHRFGVLLSEAIRGLSNVEARFFGFTDRLIYDAGDEKQCAVAALKAGGGNNDAAALYHAANVADRSRRRSKLLVMISDGLPTECSAVALRSLAEQLTRRRGILCAQVAVRPLSEVCFPHYVEIKSGDPLDVAVRRFGEIVMGLTKRALGR